MASTAAPAAPHGMPCSSSTDGAVPNSLDPSALSECKHTDVHHLDSGVAGSERDSHSSQSANSVTDSPGFSEGRAPPSSQTPPPGSTQSTLDDNATLRVSTAEEECLEEAAAAALAEQPHPQQQPQGDSDGCANTVAAVEAPPPPKDPSAVPIDPSEAVQESRVSTGAAATSEKPTVPCTAEKNPPSQRAREDGAPVRMPRAVGLRLSQEALLQTRDGDGDDGNTSSTVSIPPRTSSAPSSATKLTGSRGKNSSCPNLRPPAAAEAKSSTSCTAAGLSSSAVLQPLPGVRGGNGSQKDGDANISSTKKSSEASEANSPSSTTSSKARRRRLQRAACSQCDSPNQLESVIQAHLVGQSNLHRRNIYISGLPPHFASADFRSLCQQFGRVEALKVKIDASCTPTKGYGFALFYSEESAAACIRGLHGTFLSGRRLQARYADSDATPQAITLDQGVGTLHPPIQRDMAKKDGSLVCPSPSASQGSPDSSKKKKKSQESLWKGVGGSLDEQPLSSQPNGNTSDAVTVPEDAIVFPTRLPLPLSASAANNGSGVASPTEAGAFTTTGAMANLPGMGTGASTLISPNASSAGMAAFQPLFIPQPAQGVFLPATGASTDSLPQPQPMMSTFLPPFPVTGGGSGGSTSVVPQTASGIAPVVPPQGYMFVPMAPPPGQPQYQTGYVYVPMSYLVPP